MKKFILSVIVSVVIVPSFTMAATVILGTGIVQYPCANDPIAFDGAFHMSNDGELKIFQANGTGLNTGDKYTISQVFNKSVVKITINREGSSDNYYAHGRVEDDGVIEYYSQGCK